MGTVSKTFPLLFSTRTKGMKRISLISLLCYFCFNIFGQSNDFLGVWTDYDGYKYKHIVDTARLVVVYQFVYHPYAPDTSQYVDHSKVEIGHRITCNHSLKLFVADSVATAYFDKGNRESVFHEGGIASAYIVITPKKGTPRIYIGPYTPHHIMLRKHLFNNGDYMPKIR